MSTRGDESSDGLRRRKKVTNREPTSEASLPGSAGKEQPSSSLADSCRRCCYCTCVVFLLILVLMIYWMVPMFVQQSLLDSEDNIRSRELQNRRNSTAGTAFVFKPKLVKKGLPIWRVRNFLSSAEVEYLIRAYQPSLYNCPFAIPIPFTGMSIGGRSCLEYQGELKKSNHRLLDKIEQRMFSLIPNFVEAEVLRKQEHTSWQIVKYSPMQGFMPHFDQEGGGDPDSPDGSPMPMTFMVYLNDVPGDAGGSTQFLTDGPRMENDPTKTISVRPRKGDLLLWTTCTKRGKIDQRMYHKGEYLKHSEKWILNRFFRHPGDINLDKCKEGLKPEEKVAGRYYL